MKKKKLYILALLMFFTFAACSSNMGDVNDKNPLDNDTAHIEETTPTPEATVEDITIDEKVIYDENNIKITAKNFVADGFFGPEVGVLIENNTDKTIEVQSEKHSMNGLMVDTFFSAEVAPGKKINDSIQFSSPAIDNNIITTVKDIEFTLQILDAENFNTMHTSEVIKLTTNADASFIQTYDDTGFVAYDKDSIKVVIKKLSSSDSFWGSDLYLYMENNTNQDITIQAQETSINGFMIDPLFSSDIVAGKKAYDTMSFFEEDLVGNDVTDITELELKLRIIDADTWDEITESDVLTINFE